jgi:16S rRNA (adenine1518-N6/adenine1519-N6)-dimethyltransferase
LPRRLGQHFLNHRGILERLAEAACPSSEPLVVEIGPGRGALTRRLAERSGRLVAIELDGSLAAGLRRELPRVEVVEADVLQIDLGQWGPAVVAGNLPYYITSPILERIFGLGPLLRRAVLLVQLEVAHRLTAAPGSRDFGFLTVQTKLFTEPELLFRVPAGAFSPPPKVESAAVRLTPRPRGSWGVEEAGLLEFASRAFQHKRKTLRNNLAPFYGPEVGEWPEAGLRAEQLGLEGLIELYRRTQSPAPPGRQSP